MRLSRSEIGWCRVASGDETDEAYAWTARGLGHIAGVGRLSERFLGEVGGGRRPVRPSGRGDSSLARRR